MLDQNPNNVNNPFIGSKEQGCPPRALEGGNGQHNHAVLNHMW